MTSNLMDTEIGGEQTQYEGITTNVQPHAKEAGQLGDPSQSTTSPDHLPKNPDGSKNAEKIRYGQAISETGMGGMTTADKQQGSATTETTGGEDPTKARREQGYGGDKDMNKDIGA